MTKGQILILFILSFNIGFAQNIVINEVMTCNGSAVEDDFGEYTDWIELYNNSSQAINLNQWNLSDDEDDIDKWQFPDTTIFPNDFILVFCSGRDTLSFYLHASFKLNSSVEPVILSDENEDIIDQYSSVSLSNNISYGRIEDGSEEKTYFYISSPGFSNSNSFELNEVLFSHNAGFYDSNIELSIYSQSGNGQIYFTLNGNEPSPDSSYTFTYEEPLALVEIQNETATYAYIPTTPENNSFYYTWQTPGENVEKHVIIRARIFDNNQALCNTNTNTYFLGSDIAERFSLPVLSIVTDSISLFGYDTGIYVSGKRYIEGVIKSGNYSERGIEWERKSTIEYFSEIGDLLYEQDLGIRIHGNITRAAPQKALQFYPRNIYDGSEKINYHFFEERPFSDYKRIISRSIYSAHRGSIIRDEIVQNMAKDLNVYYQEWQPVITFINGEYWGVQNLREKQDEYYLKQHFEIDTDSVDIVELWGVAEAGDLIEHSALLDFTENNDLSLPENYNVVKTMIDIPAYIDYYITEIFVQNGDWPGNNYTKWRKKGENQKWRWFLYDLDATLKSAEHNSLLRATGDTLDPINPPWSTQLFKAMLQNDEFSDQFLSRFVFLLNNDFSPENTIPFVDKWESLFENEVEHTIFRWGILNNIYEWREALNDIKEFLELRPCFLKAHLEEYFDVENLDIPCDSSTPANPAIQIVKVLPNPTKKTLYVYSTKEIVKWEIYNMTGSSIIRRNNCNSFYEEIDVSNLSTGVYSLIIWDQQNRHIKKIIKN